MPHSSSESLFLFEEFEAVAPRIFGKKPARSGERVVIRGSHGVGDQRLAELGEIGDGESGVRLFRGTKITFHADVDLLVATLEPATASGAERSRLVDFTQAQKRAVEFASSGFAALRSGQLDVVDAGYHRLPLSLGYLQRTVLYSMHQRFSASSGLAERLLDVFLARG
jgi:hypothetical protein